jgi:hypothetical protein
MGLGRREFLLSSGVAAAGLTISPAMSAAATAASPPWYRRVRRWGQINISEPDARDFDVDWWRRYWRETGTQGMLLNAAGVVAYYPTKVPFHKRSEFLQGRDLFGDLAKVCRDEGIAVVARLRYKIGDDNKELLAAHPDWASIDAQGRPGDPCMNGPFIYEYWPQILKEIASSYKPDGFSSSGWGVNYELCYCPTCTRLFREKTGQAIPRAANWDDPFYRTWVEWNSDQVVALWDFQNAVTRRYGGADCLWIGQIVGTVAARDGRKLSERAKMLMLDHQFRSEGETLAENSTTGKIFNGLMGWNQPVAAAQSLYFGRLASAPVVETQAYIHAAVAGGLVPWWHTIAAYHEDKRRYDIVGPVYDWHRKNEQYLFDRKPVAAVGVVWSEVNNLYFGRDAIGPNVVEPWNGTVEALVQSRIPFVAVHADHIDRDAAGLRVLVLPNLAAMTSAQVASVRKFVANGGALLATGQTSLRDRFGNPLDDFALADLFKAHALPEARNNGPNQRPDAGMDGGTFTARQAMKVPAWARARQNYIRLFPELRANSAGPRSPKEPAVEPGAKRHPALAGFDRTDVIMLGSDLKGIKAAPDAQVLAVYVPPTSVTPEDAWMRIDRTDIPALIVNEAPGMGRVAFLPADLDRQYARTNNPDHAAILANIVRWLADDSMPLTVDGPGQWDVNLYKQPGRFVLHVGSLNSGTTHPPAKEFIPAGPLRIRVAADADTPGREAKLLVAGTTVPVSRAGRWIEFEIPQIAMHEVAVIS